MSYLREKLPELSPVVEMEPWRRALLDAAEYIRAHGWCQAHFRSPHGDEVCAWGALIYTARDGHDPDAWQLPYNKLERHVGCIPSWNDAPERTKEDVIRALTECARS